MDSVFACPKCGYELKAEGLVAGREVRCDWCESWVEVPFLPRVAPARLKRRRRRRTPRWLVAAWSGVAALALVLLVIAATRWMHSRSNLIQEQRVSALLRSAEADEEAGRLGDAVSELEAALTLLRWIEPASSPRLANLARRRDALVRREIQGQLQALEGAPPDAVIGRCLTLLARVHASPALSDLDATIRERLRAAALRSAADDLAGARGDLDAGRLAGAQTRCERLARTLEHLDPPARDRLTADARSLVSRVAERAGAVVEPVTGEFTFGDASFYNTALQPVLIEFLHQRGYLTCPDASPWHLDWSAAAPFHVSLAVDERFAEHYLQSRNRVSHLTVHITLWRSDSKLWQQLAMSRTQVPVPRMPAYQAARIGVGNAPVPEYERVLYDNARALFVDRFRAALTTLPEWSKLSTDSAPRPVTSGMSAKRDPS